jgi:lipid IVA palmitoyltransferase
MASMTALRYRLMLLVVAAVANFPRDAAALDCADFWTWLERGCDRVVDTYEHGDDQLLVSGYSYHIPATWTPERRAMLNSNAWGAGYGRMVEDPNGDTHTVFFLGFEDSHRHAELQIGYAYATYWGSRDSLQAGLGWTAMIAQRPDIAGGYPFPVLLPLAFLRYHKANFVATYIPKLNGGVNHGSTLYMFGQIGLN